MCFVDLNTNNKYNCNCQLLTKINFCVSTIKQKFSTRYYIMFKVFYNLQNDIVDRQSGNIGILDVLQSMKCNIYTEISQLRGEKIDMAYITHNDQLISQLGDLQIKKISIITKYEDDIIVPRQFVKYSSDMVVTQGKFCNVILNNKSYKTENEILINGEDNNFQDVIRNIYSLFGNVITCTMGKYNIEELMTTVRTRNLPNCGNIYFHVYGMLDGLKKCVIKKNIIKVLSSEYYTDLSPIISSIASGKIVITNIDAQKVSKLKFSIGNHIIAGKFEHIFEMYDGAMTILNNKVTEMRKKIRLEYVPEQILVLGYIKNSLDYIGAKNDDYVRKIMDTKFHMVSIEELGNYRIQVGKQFLVSGKSINKELYTSVCTVKSFNDV